MTSSPHAKADGSRSATTENLGSKIVPHQWLPGRSGVRQGLSRAPTRMWGRPSRPRRDLPKLRRRQVRARVPQGAQASEPKGSFGGGRVQGHVRPEGPQGSEGRLRPRLRHLALFPVRRPSCFFRPPLNVSGPGRSHPTVRAPTGPEGPVQTASLAPVSGTLGR